MTFSRYLAYITLLAATAAVLIGLIPDATPGLATVAGALAAVCGSLYTPRKRHS